MPKCRDLFENIFDQHDAIMLLIEPKSGRIVDANKKALEFYGYSKLELTSKKIQEINCLSDKGVAKERNLALKEKRNFFTFEHKLSNDEIRLVEVHSSPISIEGQNYLFSIIHDITKRKIDEDTIRKQAAYLKTVMDNSPIAMWISNAQGTIIQVNTSLLKILNLPEKAVVGKYNVFQDQNLVKQKVTPQVEAVFENKVPARFIVWWEGNETGISAFEKANSVWIDVSMVPIVDSKNNLVNVLCQWVNITDLKETEEKIKSFSKFPDENPSPVLRFSRSGEILYASRSSSALMKQWGRSIGESVPQDWEKEIANSFTSNINLEIEALCEGKTLSFILAPIKEMGYVNAYGRDITQRIQVEEALRKNQKRYEKAQAMGHVGNWEFDPVSTEFWGSDEARKIYGFGLDQTNLTTEKVESCIVERKRVHQALIDLIEHDKKYDLVFDINTYDKGVRKTIHSIAEVERDDQGVAKKVTGVITDITEQKKTEKALQESEKRHRTYIEHAPLGIFVVDDKGKYIDVNPGACKLLGYSRQELFNLSALDILAQQEDIERFGQLEEEGAADLEFGLRRKDGSLVDVRVVAVPLPNDQFIAFCLDVTERQNFMRELKKERDKAQNYLDIAEVIISVLNSNGEIMLINHKGRQILGYEDDDLIGVNWFETCVPERKRVEFKRAFNRMLAGEIKPFEYFENPILTKTGEERIVAWHNALFLGDKENIIGILSSGEDITERKISEEKLRRSEEQYRSVVEDSPGIICKFSPDGTIIFANQEYCRFVGKELDQLMGYNIQNTIPEETRDSIWSRITSLTKESPIQVSEIEVINANGDIRWFRWTDRALFTEEGHLLNYQSFGEDITELNRSQLLLGALNRASLAMGSELTHDGIFNAIAGELKQLDINCYLILLDESQNKAVIKYLSHDSAAIRTVEKLTGLTQEDFSFSIDTIDLFMEVVREKKPLFTEDIEQIIEQMLPKVIRNLSTKIGNLLNIKKNILFPLFLEEQVVGIFSMESNNLTQEDIPAATAFADQLSATWGRIKLLQDLRNIVDGTINIIAATVEARDPYTAGHQQRVADLASAIAREMGLTDDQIEGIKTAGIVHDLGKVNIPAEILSKPGKISELEYELIKTHPQIGYDLIKHIEFPWPIGEMILQHHEKMDGSGYPSGLKGDEIMLEARILAVADIIEAMASHRPYRPSLGIEQALAQIKKDKGTLLDPEVVDACLKIFKNGYRLPDYQE